jgi:hypothetical protein
MRPGGIDGVGLITAFAQLFVCSLHIRGRARTEFDCLRAVRKFARNPAWRAPLVFLSSCRICRCSREKLPVGIFRASACPSRVLSNLLPGCGRRRNAVDAPRRRTPKKSGRCSKSVGQFNGYLIGIIDSADARVSRSPCAGSRGRGSEKPGAQIEAVGCHAEE